MNVGQIRALLSKYPDNTQVLVFCEKCRHGESSEREVLIDVVDKTNQTFGYIQIEFNKSWRKEG